MALLLAVGARGAGQSQQTVDASQRPPLPEWMLDYLPKTTEERAKAAFFDADGSSLLRLGIEALRLSCGPGMSGEPTPYLEFTTQLACGDDAVVLGTPTRSAVRINNRGTWLYTEHEFHVRRWVYPALETTTEIEVLTHGGTLNVGGQTTTVSAGEPLEARKEYLVFLKRVPGTRAFSLTRRGLIDTDGWADRLQMAVLPYELEHGDVPLDRFIDDLAIAAGNCRKPR